MQDIMLNSEHTQGRSIQESRAILAADQDLFDRLTEAWNYLRDQTKSQLVTIAEAEAEDDPEFANR